jgi:hypothetical protein
VIRNKGTGRELATVTPGQVITIGEVQAVFSPRDTTDDYFKFSVADFSDAVDDLQDAFDVTRVDPLADLVQLKYKDTDVQLVTSVPNALMTSYMSQRQDVAHAESRSTVKFLKEQLDRLTARVALRDDSLRRYEQTQRIVSLPDEARTSVERARRCGRSEPTSRPSAPRWLSWWRRSTSRQAHRASRRTVISSLSPLLRNQARPGCCRRWLPKRQARRSPLPPVDG